MGPRKYYPIIKTNSDLSYWPYHSSSPLHQHNATYDYYKQGSMYSWFLRSAAHQVSKSKRSGYYTYCPYTGQHERSYYQYIK